MQKKLTNAAIVFFVVFANILYFSLVDNGWRMAKILIGVSLLFLTVMLLMWLLDKLLSK